MPVEGSPPAERVSIRPGTKILSVLRHLNYKPWFALAEFVDNAIQSAQEHLFALKALHGEGWALKVTIDIDTSLPGRIRVHDNAAGIALSQFPRAFRPAAPPPDASGLSEFGMGMKSAACWFASSWQVRTSALSEPGEHEIHFDVPTIVSEELEDLEVITREADVAAHFTEITLDRLHHLPIGRTMGKIKEHLADIYREFTRAGFLDLRVNDERLVYQEPGVLHAPYAREPDGQTHIWRRDIDFDFGDDLKVRGFAALRDPGSHTRSGFALFRRGRLIEGSGEEGYRPSHIFGTPGNYRHLRLFGELHLDGFEVSHTKDGFRWDENEQPFLELLTEKLDADDLPLLRQADAYRALEARRDRRRIAEEALASAGDAIESTLPLVLERITDEAAVGTNSEPLESEPLLASRELQFAFRGRTWLVKIELSEDPGASDWLTISDATTEGDLEMLSIRLAMHHPFMVRFAQTNKAEVEAMVRIGAALAVAEKLARNSGVTYAGTVRRNFNEVLREGLSQP